MKWILKIVLVGLVLWAFLLANQIIMHNRAGFDKHVESSLVRMQENAAPKPWDKASSPPAYPWRKYPGAKLISHRTWMMNEVPFVEGEYLVTASAEQVVEYYRRSMAQAGWRDATEQYFNIDPELLAQSGQMEMIQSSQFMEKYKKITEANLMLQRGQQSVYLTIRPPGKKQWQTTFNLTRADAVSAKDIWIEAYASARNTSSQRSYVEQFTMEEQVRDKRMKSASYTSKLAPQSLYERMSRELLEGEGWRKEAIPVGLKFSSGSQVQAFVRGKSFALLSVRYDPSLRMSTALLTTEDPL